MLFVWMWNTMVLVGTAYVVFGLGHSGWWFALALCLMQSGGE